MQQLIAFTLLSIVCSLPAMALDDPTITVNGSAEISVRPDQVVLSASIESRSEQLSAAKDDNDKKIAAVIQFLRSSIESKDIQTDFIQIEPLLPRATKGYSNSFQGKAQQQSPDPLKPAGFVVRRGFNIRIRDINSFEKIYTGLLAKGINRVTGIKFQTSELEKLQQDARKKAIMSAKQKAELLVDELGAKLAGVQTIEDSTSGHRMARGAAPMMDPFGAVPGAPPLAVGEIQITANVRVIFRMTETDFE